MFNEAVRLQWKLVRAYNYLLKSHVKLRKTWHSEVFIALERGAHLCFTDANTSLYSYTAQTSFYLLGLCNHVLIDGV